MLGGKSYIIYFEISIVPMGDGSWIFIFLDIIIIIIYLLHKSIQRTKYSNMNSGAGQQPRNYRTTQNYTKQKLKYGKVSVLNRRCTLVIACSGFPDWLLCIPNPSMSTMNYCSGPPYAIGAFSVKVFRLSYWLCNVTAYLVLFFTVCVIWVKRRTSVSLYIIASRTITAVW